MTECLEELIISKKKKSHWLFAKGLSQTQGCPLLVVPEFFVVSGVLEVFAVLGAGVGKGPGEGTTVAGLGVIGFPDRY